MVEVLGEYWVHLVAGGAVITLALAVIPLAGSELLSRFPANRRVPAALICLTGTTLVVAGMGWMSNTDARSLNQDDSVLDQGQWPVLAGMLLYMAGLAVGLTRREANSSETGMYLAGILGLASTALMINFFLRWDQVDGPYKALAFAITQDSDFLYLPMRFLSLEIRILTAGVFLLSGVLALTTYEALRASIVSPSFRQFPWILVPAGLAIPLLAHTLHVAVFDLADSWRTSGMLLTLGIGASLLLPAIGALLLYVRQRPSVTPDYYRKDTQQETIEQLILERASEGRPLSVSSLAQELGIPTESLRKTIEEMAQRGSIRI